MCLWCPDPGDPSSRGRSKQFRAVQAAAGGPHSSAPVTRYRLTRSSAPAGAAGAEPRAMVRSGDSTQENFFTLEKSSLLGEPVPGFVTLLGVELLTIWSRTWVGVADGCTAR